MKRKSFFSFDTGLGIISGLTVAFFVIYIVRTFSPIACQLALSKIQGEFNNICNKAVLDYIDFENVDYSDIVKIEQTDGKIKGITTDISKTNHMKSTITLNIQDKLENMEEVWISLPAGGFFGLGGGIKIPVSLISVSYLEADLESSFESVGINQTRFSVSAVIRMNGKLLAVGEENDIKIETKVPVLMTVIVGDVPNTYVNVNK